MEGSVHIPGCPHGLQVGDGAAAVLDARAGEVEWHAADLELLHREVGDDAGQFDGSVALVLDEPDLGRLEHARGAGPVYPLRGGRRRDR